MQIINGDNTTLMSFSVDFTAVTFTRLYGKAYTVTLTGKHVALYKINNITKLDEDSFKALSEVQRENRRQKP